MSKHKYLINLAKEYHFIIDKKIKILRIWVNNGQLLWEKTQ